MSIMRLSAAFPRPGYGGSIAKKPQNRNANANKKPQTHTRQKKNKQKTTKKSTPKHKRFACLMKNRTKWQGQGGENYTVHSICGQPLFD